MSRAAGDGQPSLRGLAAYFLALGAVGFGGPAALVDRMRRDLVDRRGWIAPDDFELGLAISATCPGPLAYQLAVFAGYRTHGAGGAAAVALAFALAPFAIVVSAAAAYDLWSGNPLARGLFFGAGPAIVAIIARACWTLGRRTLHRAWPAWMLAAAAVAVTWITGREPLWLFAVGALGGAFLLRPAGPAGGTTPAARLASSRPGTRASRVLALTSVVPGGVTAQLFGFFFTTGCLVFGSGMVIVPFLRSAVVDEFGWLSPQQFLDSVAIGLLSPGPVVITATFVGFVVNGLTGAIAATAGMFLPAVLFTLVATPWFTRHRHHPRLIGAVRGLTAVVVGVLAGTVPLIAGPAVPTLAAGGILALVALLLLATRLPDPVVIAIGAMAGAVVAT